MYTPICPTSPPLLSAQGSLMSVKALVSAGEPFCADLTLWERETLDSLRCEHNKNPYCPSADETTRKDLYICIDRQIHRHTAHQLKTYIAHQLNKNIRRNQQRGVDPPTSWRVWPYSIVAPTRENYLVDNSHGPWKPLVCSGKQSDSGSHSQGPC